MKKYNKILEKMPLLEKLYFDVKTSDIYEFNITRSIIKSSFYIYVFFMLTFIFIIQATNVIGESQELNMTELSLAGVEFIQDFWRILLVLVIIGLLIDVILIVIRTINAIKWLKKRERINPEKEDEER